MRTTTPLKLPRARQALPHLPAKDISCNNESPLQAGRRNDGFTHFGENRIEHVPDMRTIGSKNHRPLLQETIRYSQKKTKARIKTYISSMWILLGAVNRASRALNREGFKMLGARCE